MKLQQATNRLRAMIQSLWGASNISGIVETGESSVPAKPATIKFICKNKSFGRVCGAAWEAEQFTPCPNCGQRKFVHKAEEALEAV